MSDEKITAEPIEFTISGVSWDDKFKIAVAIANYTAKPVRFLKENGVNWHYVFPIDTGVFQAKEQS